MIRKQPAGSVAVGTGSSVAALRLGEGIMKMKTKFGTVILSSLLFGQGLLGLAALVVVLTREAPQPHAVQAAAVEQVVTVR